MYYFVRFQKTILNVSAFRVMRPDKMLVYNLSWFVMFLSSITSNRLAGDPITVLRQRHGVAFKSDGNMTD